MRACLRRAAARIARAVLDRLDDTGRLTASRRSWLLEDVRKDLEAMVDDAENRGVTERAAREMLVIRSLVLWLQGDGAPPEGEAIGYLERAVTAIPRNPGKDELAFRRTYLAAIGELGGDEVAASRMWQEPSGDPEEARTLDLQGRRIRGLMEERGLTVGELAERTGIDTVTLVSIVFGLEEMRASEWKGLSETLVVSPDDLIPDHRTPADDERGGVR